MQVSFGSSTGADVPRLADHKAPTATHAIPKHSPGSQPARKRPLQYPFCDACVHWGRRDLVVYVMPPDYVAPHYENCCSRNGGFPNITIYSVKPKDGRVSQHRRALDPPLNRLPNLPGNTLSRELTVMVLKNLVKTPNQT